MIANEAEYAGALQELSHMENFLTKLMSEPLSQPDLERHSVRRLIARLHEELGAYEAYIERPPHLKVRSRAHVLDSASAQEAAS